MKMFDNSAWDDDSLDNSSSQSADSSESARIYTNTVIPKLLAFLKKHLKKIVFLFCVLGIASCFIVPYIVKVSWTQTINGVEYRYDTALKCYVAAAFDGSASTVVIESCVDGKYIEGIGVGAFRSHTSLEKVELPGNIHIIGSQAFEDCSELHTIVFSYGIYLGGSGSSGGSGSYGSSNVGYNTANNNSMIGPRLIIQPFAFSGCDSLQTIELPTVEAYTHMLFQGEFSDPCHYCQYFMVDGKKIPLYSTEITGDTISNRQFFGRGDLIEFIIPDTVVSIGASAFAECRNLTKVIIPNSVTTIEDGAFSACTALTELIIPDSVTYIGSGAFDGCTSLKSIQLSNGLTSLYSNLFNNCSALESVTVPDAVTSISSSTFQNCAALHTIFVGDCVSVDDLCLFDTIFSSDSTLKNVVIKDGVDKIGIDAFKNCAGLLSVSIPDSVTTIGDSAFLGCTALTEIVIPNQVTTISWYAFSDCTSLTEITIPANVKIIENNAFLNCPKLMIRVSDQNKAFSGINGYLFDKAVSELLYAPKSIESAVIPDTVETIGDSAFLGCTALTEIVIPNQVTTISWYAFSDCTSLTEITIPANVKIIENNAFLNCPKLMIRVSDQNKAFSGINGYLFDKAFSRLLYAPKSIESAVIPDTVTSIGDLAFFGCTSLAEIVIPNQVTTIGDYAFSGCTALTEIVLPDNVTTIGLSAFFGCTALTEIVLPDNVTTIGGAAFSGCTALTEIVIPNQVTTISWYAFSDCTSLTEITIPANVKIIENNAFLNCPKLMIRVSDQNKAFSGINGYLFDKAVSKLLYAPKSIENAEIPDTVKTIGLSAFFGCTALTEITIPNTVTSIEPSAFFGCTSLTEIVLPNQVTTIGWYAFSGCTALTEITIPNTVTSIGEYAFSSCSSLKTIHFLGTKAEWRAILTENIGIDHVVVQCSDGNISL